MTRGQAPAKPRQRSAKSVQAPPKSDQAPSKTAQTPSKTAQASSKGTRPPTKGPPRRAAKPALTDTRTAGILLHVTALPGPYGIGDLGPEAYRWVDWLAGAGQSWWQTLPLNPPGYGDSPYQCFSAFAGNPLLVSPDVLFDEGLITREDLRVPGRFPADRVDFPRVHEWKGGLIARAYERFASAGRKLHAEFERFCAAEKEWLEDYALFTALREASGHRSWTEWPRELVVRKPAALAAAKREHAEAYRREQFAQFVFFRQLDALRHYAKLKGVRLIGDLPIYVSADSADVWAHQHLFQLDRKGRPTAVAGVPGDKFSEIGQRWGNPLYDWRAMRRDRFRWWVARARAALHQADVVRIDHFRGFEAYWSIPASAPTAVTGKWVLAPGAELFEALERGLGSPLPFFAEDLGLITPEVDALRARFQLAGMRVLHFAFIGDGENVHLPHNYEKNTIAYTGTHDNDTSVGWFESLDRKARAVVARYAPGVERDPAWELMRLAWSSVAGCAVAPAQDIAALDNDARFNVPGTAEGNWVWRMRGGQLTKKHQERLRGLTETYGRVPSRSGAS